MGIYKIHQIAAYIHNMTTTEVWELLLSKGIPEDHLPKAEGIVLHYYLQTVGVGSTTIHRGLTVYGKAFIRKVVSLDDFIIIYLLAQFNYEAATTLANTVPEVE